MDGVKWTESKLTEGNLDEVENDKGQSGRMRLKMKGVKSVSASFLIWSVGLNFSDQVLSDLSIQLISKSGPVGKVSLMMKGSPGTHQDVLLRAEAGYGNGRLL